MLARIPAARAFGSHNSPRVQPIRWVESVGDSGCAVDAAFKAVGVRERHSMYRGWHLSRRSWAVRGYSASLRSTRRQNPRGDWATRRFILVRLQRTVECHVRVGGAVGVNGQLRRGDCGDDDYRAPTRLGLIISGHRLGESSPSAELPAQIVGHKGATLFYWHSVTVAVPAVLNCDVAFVQDVYEHHWLCSLTSCWPIRRSWLK